MKYLSYFAAIFLLSAAAYAQTSSFQINGGLVSPVSSSKGLSLTGIYYHGISPDVNVYISAGYAVWDKYYVYYQAERSAVQKKIIFKTHAADNNVLIPIAAGIKYNFHSFKTLTSFLRFEIGYSYFSYNNYNHSKSINPHTTEVLGYYPSFLNKITEHLIGMGFGAGLSHKISPNIGLTFTYMLNTQLNSKYYQIFASQGTYSAMSAGFEFTI